MTSRILAALAEVSGRCRLGRGQLPLVIACALAVGCAGPAIQRTRNVVYTPPDWPEPVRGDIYQPKSDHPLPAILLVHGGGWTGGDTRWHMNGLARKLAKRGYYVLNVTYRQAPKYTYPAPLNDLQEGVKWLRRNADEQGIDPERIAVYGYSAGGYLGSLLGLMEGPDKANVRVVVAGAAPANLTVYAGGDLVPQFLGGRLHEVPERFHAASPVNYVTPDSPPFFLYHGERDHLVRPEHSLQMQAELLRHQVPHEVFWIPDKGHITAFLMPEGAVDAAMDFLDRYMK